MKDQVQSAPWWIHLLLIVGVWISIVLVTIWSGFVLQKVWGWHMGVLGFGPLGLLQAIGVMYVVSYLTTQSSLSFRLEQLQQAADSSRSDFDNYLESTFFGILSPAIVLLMGWIVHILQ